jgi:hypothetical protein
MRAKTLAGSLRTLATPVIFRVWKISGLSEYSGFVTEGLVTQL